MIGAAVDFQAKVAKMRVELETRLLISPKPGVTPEVLAQRVCDGARGIGAGRAAWQARPFIRVSSAHG